MKQVFLSNGKVFLEDTPIPMGDDKSALIKVTHSVVSIGTEVNIIKQSKKETLSTRIVKQPAKVLKLASSLRTKGFTDTIRMLMKMQKTLGEPVVSELGYSCSGIVISSGKEILDLRPGDRVSCGGIGKAVHAEVVSVPRNLIVKVPDGVSLKDAASATIGAIAMQGVRQADVRIGEFVAVIGLGLIGQLTVQILQASGCRVIGIDLIRDKIDLAERNGIFGSLNAREEDVIKEITQCTNDKGVDATIITASSPGDAVLQQAMEITRKKGVVVVVGAVGLGLKRQPFYRKEIGLKISCSYGPGRYDESYEEKGNDYPYSYVRWTENRNMEEYLRLIDIGKIDFSSLISTERPVEEAPQVYRELKQPSNKQLGVIFKYNYDETKLSHPEENTVRIKSDRTSSSGKIRVGVVGAGNFANEVHLPNLKLLHDLYEIRAIASRNGNKAKETAKKFAATYATTDYRQILNDPEIDMVIITTRHDLHARLGIEAAEAGKAILLEKPMALNETELNELSTVLRKTNVPFLVGFNRRFSPCATRAKEIIGKQLNPIMVFYRVNARHIPLDHWIHGPEGGGRIIGEACHMIDFFAFLTESKIATISVSAICPKTSSVIAGDNISATFEYANGSVCTLLYTSLGTKEFGKEYIEIYSDQKVIIIDDFKQLILFGTKQDGIISKTIEKGLFQELETFSNFIKNPRSTVPISLECLEETTKTSIQIASSIQNNG